MIKQINYDSRDNKLLFIVWSPFSGRSEELARKLNSRIFLIHYFKFKVPIYSFPKYILQFFSTLKILVKERPKIIFVETPPIFAVLTVYLYAHVFASKYFIDAHSGLFVSWKWKWLNPLQKILSRKALVTIVTNKNMAKTVEGWGAKAYVIPVTLPTFDNVNKIDSLLAKKKKSIVVINTFADDEPIEDVIKASFQIKNIEIYITGDISKAPKSLINNKSNNVIFTGFLPKDKYLETIEKAWAVMVLTTRQNTMQMGAYEAVTLEKPIIISNSELLINTFNKGCVYVENNSDGIVKGITEMFENYIKYSNEIKNLKIELSKEFDEKILFLKDNFIKEK